MMSKRWWTLKGDAMTRALQEHANSTRPWHTQNLADRYKMCWYYERDRLVNRYGWSKAIAYGSGSIRQEYDWCDTQLASPNIIRSAVDTLVSWILENQPPLVVRANGAKFEDAYRIEELSCALDGTFNTVENERVMSLVGRDAALCGVGWCWPCYSGGSIEIRRLLPWQVGIDPFDSRDGDFRSVHVTELRDRADVLNIAENWKYVKNRRGLLSELKTMERVTDTSRKSDQVWTVYDSEMADMSINDDSDRLRLIHSWRAASYPGRNDGRYVVRVEGGNSNECVVLLDQPFDRTTLPVVPVVLNPPDEGVSGTGYGHLLLSWQHTLDRVMHRTQYNLEKFGHKKLMIPGTAPKGMAAAWKRQGITVIEGSMEQAPRMIDAEVVRKEDLDHVDRVLSLSMSTYGINTMMTRGSTDLGANASGAAQREESYRSLDRFSNVANQWHAARCRIASEVLNLLDDVLKSDPQFSADYEYMGRSRRIPWSELLQIRDRCAISLEARGEAAVRRGGRVARIQEWAAQGLLDPNLAKEALLSTPDLQAAARVALAPLRLVEWQIRRVIESDEWDDARPDADTPLELAIARCTAMIQLAQVQGADYPTLERLREYKLTAASLVSPPPAPAPMGGPMGGPTGMPAGMEGIENLIP